VAEEDLIKVMNVADDALCRDLAARGIKDRCKAELTLLSKIEKASMEAKQRCDLVLQILVGAVLGPIEETLRNNEAS
jgi:F0F1-type ATP synthase assembly protein I